MDTPIKSGAVIGGGPAGLIAAEVLIENGMQVDIYDSMPSLGRKFLMAGKSGLNITHSESHEKFTTHYGRRQKKIEKYLNQFTPEDLRVLVKRLRIETFFRTSGRVFPVGIKTTP